MEGIGTVELRVKRTPNASGPSAHSTIVLKDVLHVPSYICNILGITKDFRPQMQLGGSSSSSNGRILDEQGRSIAYFDPKSKLLTLKLSGMHPSLKLDRFVP